MIMNKHGLQQIASNASLMLAYGFSHLCEPDHTLRLRASAVKTLSGLINLALFPE